MRIHQVCALALATALCGCGGGGGGGGNAAQVAVAAPGPAPTPTPAATPTPASILPPVPFGLVADKAFEPFGWYFPMARADPVPLDPAKFSLSWVAAKRTYQVSYDGLGSGLAELRFPGNANDVSLLVRDAAGAALPYELGIRRLSAFAASGGVYSTSDASKSLAFFEFGLLTPPGDLPSAGSADFGKAETLGDAVKLVVDFQRGTVSGQVFLAYGDAWGPYSNTAYAIGPVPIDRTTNGFSAQFDISGAPAKGTVEGRFVGSAGDALMIRYSGFVRNIYTEEFERTSPVMTLSRTG